MILFFVFYFKKLTKNISPLSCKGESRWIVENKFTNTFIILKMTYDRKIIICKFVHLDSPWFTFCKFPQISANFIFFYFYLMSYVFIYFTLTLYFCNFYVCSPWFTLIHLLQISANFRKFPQILFFLYFYIITYDFIYFTLTLYFCNFYFCSPLFTFCKFPQISANFRKYLKNSNSI